MITIIPARSNSKRIPNKNIKDLFGKPVIAYPIDTAFKAGSKEVLVLTDSKYIGRVAREYKAEIPYYRSSQTSDDHATTYDVIKEFYDRCPQYGNEIIVLMYPCSALITPDILKSAYEKFREDYYYGANSMYTVCKYPHPIQRAFNIHSNRLKYNDISYMNTRTQDLEDMYYDTGSFYIFHLQSVIDNKSLFTNNTTYYPIDTQYCCDVDTIHDWYELEKKYLTNNK